MEEPFQKLEIQVLMKQLASYVVRTFSLSH